jgi:hypothetical protein
MRRSGYRPKPVHVLRENGDIGALQGRNQDDYDIKVFQYRKQQAELKRSVLERTRNVPKSVYLEINKKKIFEKIILILIHLYLQSPVKVTSANFVNWLLKLDITPIQKIVRHKKQK